MEIENIQNTNRYIDSILDYNAKSYDFYNSIFDNNMT